LQLLQNVSGRLETEVQLILLHNGVAQVPTFQVVPLLEVVPLRVRQALWVLHYCLLQLTDPTLHSGLEHRVGILQ
jgi:hypothetical protein